MSRTKCLCLITGAALSLGGVAQAQTASLDQGRAQAGEVLADASNRTSNLAQPAGKFTVDVHGYLQFRFDWNHRKSGDTALGADDNSNTVGFQTARTALNVSGNLFNEDWYYFVQIEADRDGGGVALQDAYGSYKFGNGWEVMWGQFKLPFLREELVSDKFQLAADRSSYNSAFTVERSQGVQFGYEGQGTRFAFAFSDGGTNPILAAAGAGGIAKNSDFTSSGEADWGLTARGEFKWAGDWKQALDFTSFPQSPFFGMVGVAGHAQNGGDTNGTVNTQIWEVTADVSLEGDGWNAFASATYAHIDPSTGGSIDNWGVMAQGGIFLGSPKWELFGRGEWTHPDGDLTGLDDFKVLTIGVNNYMMPDSHAAKFTLDFQWFLDKAGASINPSSTLIGLLPADEKNQWNIRAQMQLVF